MIDMLQGRQNQFIRTMHSDTMTYEFGPGFTEQLKQRIRLMETHRNDPVRNRNDRLGKHQAYLKDMESGYHLRIKASGISRKRSSANQASSQTTMA